MSATARIGWIPSSTDLRIASARLRCALPSRYLRDAGWQSELFERGREDRYDVVVFQKIYDEASIELTASLRDRGVLTVFDLCDNHFYNPDGLPHLAERAERLGRMLDLVDAVSVSSEPLREHVPGEVAGVVDDALDEFPVLRRRHEALLARLRGGRERVRFVWFGNAGLASPSFGLAHLPRIVPALEELHRRRPLSLTVISNSREAYERALAGARFPREYHEWDAATFPRLFVRHDVCVIPVEANPFTVCKTANRVALSLRLGVPVIADPIPSFEPFAPFVRLNDWPRSLDLYAEDPEPRARDAREGQAFVRARYTRARVVSEWSAVFRHVLDAHDRETTPIVNPTAAGGTRAP